jgi:hypothetical protein
MSPVFLLEQFAPALIVGALVTFAVGIIARWLRANWARQLAFAAAVGCGYAAAHAKSVGWPAFPPGDATYWLLFSAIASVVFGFGYGVLRDRRSIGRIVTFAMLLLGTLVLLLMPKFKHGWTTGQGAVWIISLTFAGAGTGWPLDWAIRNGGRPLSLLWLLVIAAGAGVALAISGSILFGQLAAVFSSVVFALIAAALCGAQTERAIVPALGTLFVGMIACGYFYAELPWSSALLLAVSPMTGLMVRGEASVKKELLRAALVGVPAAVAVALAFQASPPVEYY